MVKVLNCIFGIFSIIASIFCIFYPGLTFLNSGWLVTILLGIWGICLIIDYVSNRKKGNKSKSEVAFGVLGLVTGIAAAVVSVLAMFMPGIRLIFDVIILCVFSLWLIVSGITSVVTSFKVRKSGIKSWLLTLILGIIILIAGIYGIFHLIFVAQTIGLLIGIYMMIYGVRLILSLFEKNC